jgi:hypothetical protein
VKLKKEKKGKKGKKPMKAKKVGGARKKAHKRGKKEKIMGGASADVRKEAKDFLKKSKMNKTAHNNKGRGKKRTREVAELLVKEEEEDDEETASEEELTPGAVEKKRVASGERTQAWSLEEELALVEEYDNFEKESQLKSKSKFKSATERWREIHRRLCSRPGMGRMTFLDYEKV